ncbi:DUF881 domain-containing protein [Aeromicrobium ginsengisoli]|uniref:DUF881 domain-containing protein n=1 Tax=Aeromicrobium ginsengisoli TaxID=363867 RepID=A0A5M4FGS4_9ACTN|nr:DUF881 domain-containing protein [Aeromicrobium ginsengisoli]KAA1399364.1 DUF881 domain-containing protein [Aeromicrobium ginsengisoli]
MSEPEAPQRAEGLLEQIADTALDDDYYVVRAGDYAQSREFNTPLTALVLAAFAVLVMMAAVQTRNDRPATERERSTLISDVAARKKLQANREATAERLRKQVADLSASVDRFDPAYQDVRVETGDLAVSGPGITVIVSPSTQDNLDGSITDGDLQILVNGLWYAGAEAVAINGQRIGNLTGIHFANDAINVNYTDIAPPYRVVAIGPNDTLMQRFQDNPAGHYWAARQENAAVQFGMTPSSDLSVPAVPKKRMTIRHATAIKGEE